MDCLAFADDLLILSFSVEIDIKQWEFLKEQGEKQVYKSLLKKQDYSYENENNMRQILENGQI